MEYYDWEISASKQSVGEIFAWGKEKTEVNQIPNIQEYSTAITELWNEGKKLINVTLFTAHYLFKEEPNKTIMIQ